jgi:hypothetical protein
LSDPVTSVIQRNFAGGEIAPALYARTDQVKYQTGARQVRNFIVRREGGLANRPGSEKIAEIRDSTQKARLMKFVFLNGDTNDNYVLEFGDHTLRFYQDGGTVVTSGVGAWVTATNYTQGDLVTQGGVTYYAIAAHTSAAGTQPGIGATWQTVWYRQTGAIYEIPTPYAVADLRSIRFAQNKDVITYTHGSYPTQELKRFGHTRWTLSPVAFGPAIGLVTSTLISGGIAGVEYFWAVTAVDGLTGEEGLPVVVHSGVNHKPDAATPTVISWAAVAGASEYNIYRSTDGSTFEYIGTTGGVPLTGLNTTWATNSYSTITGLDGIWVAGAGQARITVHTVITDKATDGKYKVRGKISIQAVNLGGQPDTTQGRMRAFYKRDAEARVDAGIVATIGVIYGEGSMSAPFETTITVPDNGYTTLVIDLVPEVFGTTSQSGFAMVFECSIDETTVPDNSVAWNKGGTSFSDTNMPSDPASAPPRQRSGLFAEPNGYPVAVGYADGRLWLGNTNTDPERLYGSRPGIFHSFTQSTPAQDDDSVSFRLSGNQAQAIQHILELTRLLLFTGATERSVNDEGQAITPTSFVPTLRSAAGSGIIAPIIVGTDILFVQGRSKKIRSFKRAGQEFTSSDLTVMAAHLFRGFQITAWDYTQEDDSIIWVCRNDGTWLGLTYIPEQEVWGWHRHDTDGVVEDLVCLPEGTEDRIYALVQRTINGVTKRFIERFASRLVTPITDPRDLFFVDCGITYDGRNIGTETMGMFDSVSWDEGEDLNLERSVGGFTLADVGNVIQFFAADGKTLLVQATIEEFISGTVVVARPDRLVPFALRNVLTLKWARAVDQLSGLTHLEGKAVSVLADGYVVASPNNLVDFPVATVVTGGAIVLTSPAAVIHVGLPYISDLETLDIDLPSLATLKGKAMNITNVVISVEASRGLWLGPPDGPTAADPLNNMEASALRQASDEYDNPVALVTDSLEVGTVGTWDDHGRRFIRQVDPLPATILSVSPQGYVG